MVGKCKPLKKFFNYAPLKGQEPSERDLSDQRKKPNFLRNRPDADNDERRMGLKLHSD
jgi:hypothetical protein